MKTAPIIALFAAAGLLIAGSCAIATNPVIEKAAFSTSDALSVLDPDGATLASGGTAYDFGYSAGATISKTFTIRNTGAGSLTVYSVSSSNDSVLTVTAKPATNTVLAAGASATFTVALQASAMESTSSAVITVTTNASDVPEYKVNLVGGGSTIALTLNGDVGHLLTGHGIDFGYAAAQTDKTITITNSGTVPVALPLSSMALSSGTRYSVQSISSETIAAGSSVSLVVRFVPGTHEWAEDALTITSSKGRTYVVNFTGSDFKQPSDISGLALWLRADRVVSSNVTSSGSDYLINLLPDLGSNAINATYAKLDQTYDSRPRYIMSGLGNKPALYFDGYDDCLVADSGSSDILSVTSSGGITVFTAIKTGDAISGRYLFWPSYTNGWSYGYPRVQFTSASVPSSHYRISQYGYNATSYPSDSSTSPFAVSTNYVLGFQADFSTTGSTNMSGWINGTEKSMTAYSSTVSPYYTGNAILTANAYNLTMRQFALGYFNGTTTNVTFKGYISEVFIFSNKLSSDDVAAMNNYLKYKYGI